MRRKNTITLAAFIVFAVAVSILFALMRNRLDITLGGAVIKYYWLWAAVIILLSTAAVLIGTRKNPAILTLTLTAVFSALAVASRAAFMFVPQFKPLMAVVMLAGICVGPQCGFAVGAMSMFVSNFLFGQGPWTPFQMLAAGLCGLIAGLLFKAIPKKGYFTAPVGAVLTYIVYGGIMNSYYMIFFTGGATWQTLAASFASALPLDLIHCAASAVFLFVLTRPFTHAVGRAYKKYGLPC